MLCSARPNERQAACTQQCSAAVSLSVCRSEANCLEFLLLILKGGRAVGIGDSFFLLSFAACICSGSRFFTRIAYITYSQYCNCISHYAFSFRGPRRVDITLHGIASSPFQARAEASCGTRSGSACPVAGSPRIWRGALRPSPRRPSTSCRRTRSSSRVSFIWNRSID